MRKISAGLLAIAGITAMTDIFAFALSSSLLAENGFMAIIILIVVTIFNHLREVSTRHMRSKLAGAGAIAALGIGIGRLGKSASSTNTQTAQYLSQLKPPAMRLVLSKTEGGGLPTQKTLTTGLIARAPISNLAGWGQAHSILMISSPSNPSAKVQGAIFHAAI